MDPSDAELKDIIDEVDIDGDGKIDFNEFVQFQQRFSFTDAEEEVKEAFRLFDKDGNGYISVPEFRNLMINLGLKFSEEEVDEMVNAAVRDGDICSINYEEFVKFLLHKGYQ